MKSYSKDFTICICDDELSICKQLRKYIVQYSFSHDIEIEIIELNSVSQLLTHQLSYDILFLDIRFGNESIGIDVAERLRTCGNTSLIIIMSILESMIMEGYRAEPYRFILKPFDELKIEEILTACIKKITRTVSYVKVLNASQSSLIRTDRIIYIYSNKRKRHIVCTADKALSTWQTLNELMQGLPLDEFVFSQKSYIVNLVMVDIVKNGKIILTDGTMIPLGMHYKDNLMKKLLENSKQER